MTCVPRVPVSRDGPGYLYMGFWTVQVARLGPYVAQLRRHVPPLEPHAPQLGHPQTMFDWFWSPRDLEKLKNCHTVDEFLGFLNFARGHQERFQRLQKGDPREANMDFRSGQGRPRRPQERPGKPPERPKSRQERPKRTQEPPKLGFRAALTAHLSPKSFPEASRRPFWTLPGAIFHSPGNNIHTLLHLPDSICQTVLYAKLMQAYGQHRSTSLSNFDVLV